MDTKSLNAAATPRRATALLARLPIAFLLIWCNSVAAQSIAQAGFEFNERLFDEARHRVRAWEQGRPGALSSDPLIDSPNIQASVGCCLFALPSLTAQASPTPPAAPSPKSDNRVVGVVPAFNVVPFDTKTPMTSGQKFHLFWRSTLDPFSLAAPAVKALIYQGVGLNSGFGSGASGFFKRYGAAIADGTSGRFFRSYFYPTLLHEDPRYFRMGAGTKKARTGYSLTRVFVTRTDAGGSRFNWSKLSGGLSSSGLSNLYYPKENRGLGFTFAGVGFGYLGEASMNLVKEFWPDLTAKRKSRHSQSAPSPPTGETRHPGVLKTGALKSGA